MVPRRVTATCVHSPVGSAVVPSMRCSLSAPPVVIAKRGTGCSFDTRTVRNIRASGGVPNSGLGIAEVEQHRRVVQRRRIRIRAGIRQERAFVEREIDPRRDREVRGGR